VNATLLIIIGAIALVAIILVAVYNGLVQARNKCDEAWSGIDVQLKRRHDLIPNLVETVKGYAAHEQATFENVTAARAAAMSAKTPAESAKAEGVLGQALTGLFAIAEAYPQLRAVESFTQLQAELTNTEDQISASRRIYNGNVQIYNTKVQQIPGKLLAGPFGFSEKEFFELDSEAERQPVAVSFSDPPAPAAPATPPAPPAAPQDPPPTTTGG
jgi:LemA protein